MSVDSQIDRAMIEVSALADTAKSMGDLPTMYAANKAWHALSKAREDRKKRASKLAPADRLPGGGQ